MSNRGKGRPRKEIYINVEEFIDMVRFIRNHPVDRVGGKREEDVPIPETGRAYWYESLNQVLECLVYIKNASPMTSSRRVMHDKKISRYSDDRYKVYEYIRKKIIEKNGGSPDIYEK